MSVVFRYCIIQERMASSLTPQQIQEFKQAFKMFDINNDGVISPKELKIIVKQFGYTASEEDIMDIIGNIDRESSDRIDFVQYLNFLANKVSMPGDEQQELRHAFKMFDKDGNGLISKQEMFECLNRLGENMSEEDAQELMGAADDNISFQEFVELMRTK